MSQNDLVKNKTQSKYDFEKENKKIKNVLKKF
jgi:hypothetical protein